MAIAMILGGSVLSVIIRPRAHLLLHGARMASRRAQIADTWVVAILPGL